MEPVLKFTNLTKEYNNVAVVDGLSLEVQQGDIFGFLGNNGAGKTTTIRMTVGLLRPTEGSVRVNGYDIKKDRIKALEHVGALVEGPAFYSYLSGFDNLNVFSSYHRQKIPKARILELLEKLGLAKHIKKKVGSYSLGMKQRLGIAQALLNNPKLIVLDEPTNGLDPHGVKEIRNLIRRLNREEGVSFFISSHILSEVQQVCNKVAIIDHGKLITVDTVNNILNKDGTIYFIESTQPERLLTYLKRRKDIEITNEKNIHVNIGNLVPKDFLGELVKQGIEVAAFAPYRPQLEDFFYHTTDRI